ncbi:hypothetical protein JB92DRAFT_3120372 [Gautieria morchelliformis]|nr:hypothetical protein JB92DRAFT_3120372 [Gautieria morchelliformis]
MDIIGDTSVRHVHQFSSRKSYKAVTLSNFSLSPTPTLYTSHSFTNYMSTLGNSRSSSASSSSSQSSTPTPTTFTSSYSCLNNPSEATPTTLPPVPPSTPPPLTPVQP